MLKYFLTIYLGLYRSVILLRGGNKLISKKVIVCIDNNCLTDLDRFAKIKVSHSSDWLKEVKSMNKFKLLDRPDDWYVSRTAELSEQGLAILKAGTQIVGRHGSVLTILSSGSSDGLTHSAEESSNEKIYQATLSHNGRLSPTHPLELVIRPLDSKKAEVGLRVLDGKPHRFISPQRYFTSAWSILDKLYEQFEKKADSRAA